MHHIDVQNKYQTSTKHQTYQTSAKRTKRVPGTQKQTELTTRMHQSDVQNEYQTYQKVHNLNEPSCTCRGEERESGYVTLFPYMRFEALQESLHKRQAILPGVF